MPRRLVLLAAGAAVVLGGIAPTHAAGRPTGCAALTDPRGDAHAPSAALYQPAATPGVDISAVKIVTDDQRLIASITVGDLAQQPVSSTSTRISLEFVFQSWDFGVFYAVTPVPSPVGEQIEQRQGITEHGAVVSTKVRASVSGSTVTLDVALDELERLRGKAIRGQALRSVDATTRSYYAPEVGAGLRPQQSFDTVEAARALAIVPGGPCRTR